MKLKYLVLLFFVFPFVTSAEVQIPRTEEEAIIRFTISRAKESNIDPKVTLAKLWCESRLDPKALNFNKNGTSDAGIAQLNDIHLPQIRQMNLSRFDPYDSINFMLYLIQTSKYDPYSASSKCWKDPKTMKHISSLIDS